MTTPNPTASEHRERALALQERAYLYPMGHNSTRAAFLAEAQLEATLALSAPTGEVITLQAIADDTAELQKAIEEASAGITADDKPAPRARRPRKPAAEAPSADSTEEASA